MSCRVLSHLFPAHPMPSNGGSLWIAPHRKFRLALHFAFAFRAKSDRRVAETRSAAPGFKRRVKGPNRAVKGPTTVRPGSNDRTSDRPTAIHFWGGYPYRPAITNLLWQFIQLSIPLPRDANGRQPLYTPMRSKTKTVDQITS